MIDDKPDDNVYTIVVFSLSCVSVFLPMFGRSMLTYIKQSLGVLK